MKLAEALTERADIQKRIQQIKSRLQNNAKVQEGEKPAEDPKELLKQLDEMTVRLEELITRINITNSETKTGKETMTSLLARRDCMSQKNAILRDFLENASETVMRGMKTEIVIRSAVNVKEMQKQVDASSKELRDLDVKIQGLNWTTDVK